MKLEDWIPQKNRYGNGGTFGWISPDNIVHITESLEHIKFLQGIPELNEAFTQYDAEVTSNAEWMDIELEWAAKNDEHPEMHRFDGMDDDARDKLYLAAYNLGWVRWGTTVDYSDWRSKPLNTDVKLSQLEIYGSPEGIERVIKYSKKVSKEMNLLLRAYSVMLPKKGGYNSVFRYEVIEHNFWK